MNVSPKPDATNAEPRSMRSGRQRLILLIKLAIAATLIGWLVRTGHFDLNVVFSAFHNPAWFSAGVFSFGLTFVIAALRWRYLMAGQGIALKFGETLRLSVIGMFFSTILPGGISGDAVKVYYVAGKFPERKTATVFAILMDRILGLATLMVFALAAIATRWETFGRNPQIKSVAVVLALCLCALLISFALALSNRIRYDKSIQALLDRLPFSSRIHTLYETVHMMKRRPAPLLKALAASFVVALLSTATFFFLGRAMGNMQNTIADYSIVVPLIFVAVVIPIAPAGIGVGQAAAMLFFSWVGIRGEGLGAAIMTLQQTGTILFSLVGALIFLTHKREMAKAIVQSKEEARLHGV